LAFQDQILHRHPDLQSAHDVIRRLSAVSAELAACLDAVILELHKAEPFDPDPGLVRCAQNLAATQVAITQQILWLTRLIETREQPSLVDVQPLLASKPVEVRETHPEPARSVTQIQAFPRQALPAPTQAAFEPATTPTSLPSKLAEQVYAQPARLGPQSSRAIEEPTQNTVVRFATSRPTIIAGLLLLIVGLWSWILNPSEPDTAQLTPAIKTATTDGTAEKLQERLSDSIATGPNDENPHQVPQTEVPKHDEAANAPPFPTAPLSQPTIVVTPPRQAESPKQPAEETPTEPTIEASHNSPRAESGVEKPEAATALANKDLVPEKAPDPEPQTLSEKRLLPEKARSPEKPPTASSFKTTVQPTPPKFAPVILVLKDSKAALQIFQDVQRRHTAVLGNKTAEIRSVTGTDQTPWAQILAVPPSSKEEAQALCQQLGVEGTALGCKVVPY